MALLLSNGLRRLGRGSAVRWKNESLGLSSALQDAQGRAPCQKFAAALEACGLRGAGPLGMRLGACRVLCVLAKYA